MHTQRRDRFFGNLPTAKNTNGKSNKKSLHQRAGAQRNDKGFGEREYMLKNIDIRIP